MKEFITAVEAANILKIAPSAVRQAIQKGTLEGGKFKEQYIVSKEALASYTPRKYRERTEGQPGGRPKRQQEP